MVPATTNPDRARGSRLAYFRGVATGRYIGIYTPNQSTLIFLCGCFVSLTQDKFKLYPPKNSWLRLWPIYEMSPNAFLKSCAISVTNSRVLKTNYIATVLKLLERKIKPI